MRPITDLTEYRASHPPAVRCAIAMQRCWIKWAMLPWEMSLRLFRRGFQRPADAFADIAVAEARGNGDAFGV